MTHAVSRLKEIGRGHCRVTALCASAGLAVLIVSSPVLGQDKNAAPAAKPAAKTGAAPAKAAAASGGERVAWVKLCSKRQLKGKDKDGKEVAQEKELCRASSEQTDALGRPQMAAMIQWVEGEDRRQLVIMVPPGVAIGPGVRAAVLTTEQAAKLKKGEKVEGAPPKDVKLTYTACEPQTCVAEAEAKAELLDQMKNGGVLFVEWVRTSGPTATDFNLTGFSNVYQGKPTDIKEYAEKRRLGVEELKRRQEKQQKAELAKDPELAAKVKKYEDAQRELAAAAQKRRQAQLDKVKAEQMKNLPAQPGGKVGAPAPAGAGKAAGAKK